MFASAGIVAGFALVDMDDVGEYGSSTLATFVSSMPAISIFCASICRFNSSILRCISSCSNCAYKDVVWMAVVGIVVLLGNGISSSLPPGEYGSSPSIRRIEHTTES